MFEVLQPDFAVDFTVLQFFYAVDFGLCVADFSQFCSLIPKYLTFDLFLSLPLLILIISVISSESGSSDWEGRDQPLSWFFACHKNFFYIDLQSIKISVFVNKIVCLLKCIDDVMLKE